MILVIPITVCEIMKKIIDKGEEEVDVANSNMVIMVSVSSLNFNLLMLIFPVQQYVAITCTIFSGKHWSVWRDVNSL